MLLPERTVSEEPKLEPAVAVSDKTVLTEVSVSKTVELPETVV